MNLERILQNIAYHICLWLIELFLRLVPAPPPSDMEQFPTPTDDTVHTMFEHDPNEPPIGERITTSHE